jgi:hypothetical protein
LLGQVPLVGMSAVTRGLRLTAVDSAGRRKKVSTILVEPAHPGERHDDGTKRPDGGTDATHGADDPEQSRREHSTHQQEQA